MEESSNNVAIANGSGLNGTITGGLVAPVPYPNVCPGCGRCRDCGHPYTAPYVPPYQPASPFWPPYSQPVITCGPNTGIVQTGIVALNATNAAQPQS
jgi:hypothetical protein